MNKQSMGGHRRPMRSNNVKNRPKSSQEPEKPRTEPDAPLERDPKPPSDTGGRRQSSNPTNFLFNPGRQDSIVSLLNNYQTNGGAGASGASGVGPMSAGSDQLGSAAASETGARDQRLDANAPSYYMNHRDSVMYPQPENVRPRSDSVFLPPPLGLSRNDDSVSYQPRNNSIFSSMIQMPNERSSERGSAGGPDFDWRQQPPQQTGQQTQQSVSGPQNDRRSSKPSFDMSLWESLNVPGGSIAGLPISSGSLSGILAGINNGSIDFTNMTNAERRDSILKLLEQTPDQQQIPTKPQPGAANLKEDIFSNRKMKHDDVPDNVAPDSISPVSSGSAKSIYKDEPQSPGSSPQFSMRNGQQPQQGQLRNPTLQPQYSNQVYNQTVNQFPNQSLVPNMGRQQSPPQNVPTNISGQGFPSQQPIPLDFYDYKRLQPYPYQTDNVLMDKKPPDQKEIPAQQLVKAEDGHPLLGATKVDQLMLVLQARDKGNTKEIRRAPDGSILVPGEGADSVVPEPVSLVGGLNRHQGAKDEPDDETDHTGNGKKKAKAQECPYCHKTFTQSTHLEVHVRSHIGYKPYECTYCHKRFTQGGNLRTHLRLHTGEKPFVCDVCKRSFSRKGNLEMHKLTHEKLKPFQCKLDDCGKSFTQLGNLKSHQNRFHLETLNMLTKKVAELSGASIEKLPQEEKDLLNYFKDLYKNSNKGIRGRGKRTPAPDSNKLASAPVGGLTNVPFQDGVYDMSPYQ